MRTLWLRLVAFALLVFCLAATPWAMERLPVRALEFLEPPPPPWEGIVTVGLVATWGVEGFPAWLNAQARLFEKDTAGTLLSIASFNPAAYQQKRAAASLPDVVVLGAYVETRPGEVFTPLPAFDYPARGEALRAVATEGGQWGLPLALGAYGLLGNVPAMDAAALGPNSGPEALATAGAAVFCPVEPYADTEQALAHWAGGVFLQTRPGKRALVWPAFALEQGAPFYLATQREARRMALLRSSGRCFDTVVLAGGPAFTDQLLYLAVPLAAFTSNVTDAAPKREAALGWAARLLGEEAQAALSGAGLFAVRPGLRLYDKGDMAALEANLNGPITIPSAFAPPPLLKAG